MMILKHLLLILLLGIIRILSLDNSKSNEEYRGLVITGLHSEKKLRETLQNLENLKRYGWNYLIFDKEWWGISKLSFDEYGRPHPSNLFYPHSTDRLVGFLPLAQKLHEKGYKIGLVLPAGIPKEWMGSNFKVSKGSEFSLDSIVDIHMQSCIDRTLPIVGFNSKATSSYFRSLYNLINFWGIDMVLSSPCTYEWFNPIEIKLRHRYAGRALIVGTTLGGTKTQEKAFSSSLSSLTDLLDLSQNEVNNFNVIRQAHDRIREFSTILAKVKGAELADRHGKNMKLHLGILRFDSWIPEIPLISGKNEKESAMTLWSLLGGPIMISPSLDEFSLDLMRDQQLRRLNQRSKIISEVFVLSPSDGSVRAWKCVLPPSQDGEDITTTIFIALFNLRNSSSVKTIVSESSFLHDSFVLKEPAGNNIERTIPPNGVVLLSSKDNQFQNSLISKN